MVSESARMTTAHEARFRVNYPNSVPRTIKVVALDEESKPLIDEVSRLPWNRASFFTSMSFEGATPRAEQSSIKAWLNDIAGHTRDLIAEIDEADFVVMVAGAGEDAQGASIIGEACLSRNVTTIGLIVQSAETRDEDLSRTLGHMRPFAKMLVIASGREYVEVMLTALRA
ncbi:MAG TPA: hypothetical protein VH743_05050 [Beijerinckiaceae bacterium]|jgi:hypothetical protein